MGAMSAGHDIAYASAVSLLDLYRKKALSPVEVTRLLLDRLDRLQPKINAFCIVDRDGALAAARASERRWQRGEEVGRLDGVPVTIKDLMLMRGFPTMRGSRLVDPDQDWSEDAPAVARLREAGAVILGKTTTPEFGWKALGDSPLTGITRNPWNLSRTPGGSSAGAAAACAAGIGPLHLGSDGAGSIRIPAAFTGIFGLKPSFGRVPAYPLSAMGLLAHLGPMARTVEDAALMLTVLSEPDHRDPYALPPENSDWRDGIEDGVRGWRIAYSPTLGYAKVDPEIAAAVTRRCNNSRRSGRSSKRSIRSFRHRARRCSHYGRRVRPSSSTAIPQISARWSTRDWLRRRRRAQRIGAVDYLGADLVRTELGQQMAAFHQKYDLLLTPMMPIPALPVGTGPQ